MVHMTTGVLRGWSELPRRAFEYSSGRIIAFTRLVLAVVFFLSLWVDPAQPARASALGYALLFGYMLVAAALLVTSWRSWWWDHRLAWPAMLIDVLAFLAAVFFTESTADDFTSPFLAFFAFLMLAATIRWDWRMTLITGSAITGLYLLTGLGLAAIDVGFDNYRFGRRVIYMFILALILAWFGLQRREQAIERFVERLGDRPEESALLEQALYYAASQSHARRAAIAWGEYEEPDVELRTLGLAAPGARLGPAELDAETGFARYAQLFDRAEGRSLLARRGQRPVARKGLIGDRLAELCGIDEGVALPLIGLTGRGELLLCDIDGVGSDHVQRGTLLAREVTAAFDRQATLALAGETALARMRDSLAHDLHDSVAQSLAGASLRLEGLRAWIRDGGDPDTEIDAMKLSLREEQGHVRSLIARLRLGTAKEANVDAGEAMRRLLASLSVQWGVAVQGSLPEVPVRLPGRIVHELEQVLREAVANAVRHGNANHVTAAFTSSADGELRLTIRDDGAGFPPDDPDPRPWSIAARIDKLGGWLSVSTRPGATTLDISIPKGALP
jgi:signal transduction histidine kinase